MRCDGTEANGVHDVAEFDFTTPITVVATYEDGVHTLRPVGLPGVEVTRALDGEEMVWSYLGRFVSRPRRIGGPDDSGPAPDRALQRQAGREGRPDPGRRRDPRCVGLPITRTGFAARRHCRPVVIDSTARSAPVVSLFPCT